jgi:hypothetical protein
MCRKQEIHIFCKQKEEMTGRDQKLLQKKKKGRNKRTWQKEKVQKDLDIALMDLEM